MEETIPTGLKRILETFVEREYISKDQAEKINDETRFYEDWQMDSLDQYELGYALEEEFGISIPDGDMQSFKTVGDVKKYLEFLFLLS